MAKISIISDLHLGFGRGGEREEDPFRVAEEAFEKAKERESDIVLLAGDIFDSRLPRPEHWSRFMNLLSVFREERKTDVELHGKDVPEGSLGGTPVVAIHGTHERRGESLTNPIEGVEDAGFLVHLHCEKATFDLDGERITVHGMSGVPEKYSKEVLKKWDPEPVDGSYNIFMIHQDLEPYIYNPKNPPSLGLKDLPEGFDLYVSGHIHWREKAEVNGSPFLIPGSLIPTQLKKKEAERDKGFFLVNTESDDIEFVQLEDGRGFFYREVEVNGSSLLDIEDAVEKKLEDIFSNGFERKPIVRIKVEGELPKGVEPNDVDLSDLRKGYREDGIVSVKKDLREAGVEENIEMLREAREDELSVEEMGMKVLREQVEETGSGVKPGLVFGDLVEGNIDRAIDKLMDGVDEETERGDDENKNEDIWWRK